MDNVRYVTKAEMINLGEKIDIYFYSSALLSSADQVSIIKNIKSNVT